MIERRKQKHEQCKCVQTLETSEDKGPSATRQPHKDNSAVQVQSGNEAPGATAAEWAAGSDNDERRL